MKRMLVLAIGVCGFVAAGASRAEAQMTMKAFQGFFTGHVGMGVGGDASNPVFTPGATASVQEANGWGAELDFGYSPDLEAGGSELEVATYMFNGNWVQPRGRLRPFGAAGLGVIQADGCAVPCTRPSKTYDLGLTLGGGAQFLANDLIGFRADVRYFRTLADHPDLNRPDHLAFWRLSLGVTLAWTILP
jgi:hypothetical protein